ncbi:Uncharacterized protein GBIM_08971, partial [Gryllus bimaculatus]
MPRFARTVGQQGEGRCEGEGKDEVEGKGGGRASARAKKRATARMRSRARVEGGQDFNATPLRVRRCEWVAAPDAAMTEAATATATATATASVTSTSAASSTVSLSTPTLFNLTTLGIEEEVNGTDDHHVGALPWCESWQQPQHVLFQLANACFVISYAAPSSAYGVLFMHSALIFGFMLFSFWAWNVICAPDVFSWNFTFMLLNMGQLVYIIYQMRPVKFDPELEEAYQVLFFPFKVNVMSDHQFLHPIMPCEFLDSPEFESSRATTDDKFKVSIVAATSCRYLYWQRSALEYLFVKETYLATVITTLIARDITTKLYAMNRKIVTEKGSHLDIRLPSMASTSATAAAAAAAAAASAAAAAAAGSGSASETKSPAATNRASAQTQSALLASICPTSPEP